MMQILELSADLDHERLDERIKKLRGIFSDVFDLDFEGKLYKQMGNDKKIVIERYQLCP